MPPLSRLHPPSVRLLLSVAAGLCGVPGHAADAPVVADSAPSPVVEDGPVARPMYIRQYRVQGTVVLPSAEVQTAVYPFMGPGRLPTDVDNARAALEKAYHDKGYKAVRVTIPQQKIRQGVIVLKVEENPIGRLRVRGANYTSADAVKSQLPALEEGKPVNFDELQKQLVAAAQYPGREITPSLNPGHDPSTIDVNLQVKDELPLHGSLELNNRYSAGTVPMRLNGALNYDNLWQLGHSIGFNFQVAPEDINDAQVYSLTYTIRSPHTDGWSFMLQGTKQDSDVSTLGGLAVVGRGEILGFRAMKSLPMSEHYSQSLSLGMDYKHFDENLSTGTQTPITYYPFSALYTSTWKQSKGHTDLNAGLNWHFRGMGDGDNSFGYKRYKSSGGYAYLRADLSHTQDLNTGYQWFAKIQGQASSGPLINSEQFAGGGLGSVRGYLESEALGDDAVFGTIEFRSPSLIGKGWSESDDLRVYGFFDGGVMSIHDALPLQSSGEQLASFGVGARGRFLDHFNGSVDAAYPLFERPTGKPQRVMYTFRLWGDF